MTEDPVCGMKVDEKRAEFKTSYKGRTYYFCSSQCQKQFKTTPEKFVSSRGWTNDMLLADPKKEEKGRKAQTQRLKLSLNVARGKNMLCCVGLFAGFAIGQYIGSPWTLVAPAVGFVVGLLGDVKLWRRHNFGE